MKISYGITTHNEGEIIEKLVNKIRMTKNYEYEIVIVDDCSTDEKTLEILEKLKKENILIFEHKLNNDFASQKNFLNEKCSGDYIFNIDADETPPDYLIENLKLVLQSNAVDIIWVPRINIVEGLTNEHILKWRWNVNDQGWINFPDFQGRIYKNSSKIKWKHPVHEIIVGYTTFAKLPEKEEFALLHKKQIDKQEKQNEMYSGIIKGSFLNE